MTDRFRAAIPRVPAHVVVLLSASTAGYGLALASMAALQSQHEAALIAERSPDVEGLARLGSGHDDLAERLESARGTYAAAAQAVADAAAELGIVGVQLEDLAASVAEIDGVSRQLPTSVRIPVQRTIRQVSAPRTHATTGASGG